MTLKVIKGTHPFKDDMIPTNNVDRDSILSQLRGCFLGEPRPGTLTGGRSEGLSRLRAYDPKNYGATRNFLNGTISRLSPYLRHGMISSVEIREYLQDAFAGQTTQLEEFLRQLAWRDFFEKVLAWYGRGLDEDLEEAKDSVIRSDRLPLDVLHGGTGLPCIDSNLQELFQEGYLHNHARLWFAAYLCHFCGVRWQEGARLFRQFLYDGDIASNSSSWQWVQGTFANKPYFMNKENIAKYSGSRWCDDCRVCCPFDADYASLQNRLFGASVAPLATKVAKLSEPAPKPRSQSLLIDNPLPISDNLVWVHDASLSWEDPALNANPAATVVFVFDRPSLEIEPWAYHRLAFVLDGLDDLYNHLPNPSKLVLVGDLVEQIKETAIKTKSAVIHLTEHPNPWVMETVEQLRLTHQVIIHPRQTFADYADEPKRFSKYWQKVAKQVLGYPPRFGKRRHS